MSGDVCARVLNDFCMCLGSRACQWACQARVRGRSLRCVIAMGWSMPCISCRRSSTHKQSMGLIEATMKQRELGMMNGMLERNSLAHAWLTCTKPFLRKSSDDMSLVRT